jgi:hypothetical protein
MVNRLLVVAVTASRWIGSSMADGEGGGAAKSGGGKGGGGGSGGDSGPSPEQVQAMMRNLYFR